MHCRQHRRLASSPTRERISSIATITITAVVLSWCCPPEPPYHPKGGRVVTCVYRCMFDAQPCAMPPPPETRTGVR
eukprot:9337936-Pyramimonas_sp.AAC.1